MAGPAPGYKIETPEDFASAFAVSRETLDRLYRYVDVLVQWQRTINLVAPASLDEVWHRHIADSAQLLPLMRLHRQTLARDLGRSGAHWLDLGSGAGFPGLVLAILAAGDAAEAADLRVTLLEGSERKCAFLHEAVRQTGIRALIAVDIANARIENPTTQSKLGPVQAITARALAPLDRLLALAAPYFGPETAAFFLKGRDADTEIAGAEHGWRFDRRCWPSLTDGAGRIVEIRSLAPGVGGRAKTQG